MKEVCMDSGVFFHFISDYIFAAIERAMAYLDTRELPWDMDIFNQVHINY